MAFIWRHRNKTKKATLYSLAETTIYYATNDSNVAIMPAISFQWRYLSAYPYLWYFYPFVHVLIEGVHEDLLNVCKSCVWDDLQNKEHTSVTSNK